MNKAILKTLTTHKWIIIPYTKSCKWMMIYIQKIPLWIYSSIFKSSFSFLISNSMYKFLKLYFSLTMFHLEFYSSFIIFHSNLMNSMIRFLSMKNTWNRSKHLSVYIYTCMLIMKISKVRTFQPVFQNSMGKQLSLGKAQRNKRDVTFPFSIWFFLLFLLTLKFNDY